MRGALRRPRHPVRAECRVGHAAGVRPWRALGIRHRHRLGWQGGRGRQRADAGRLSQGARARPARHGQHRLRSQVGRGRVHTYARTGRGHHAGSPRCTANPGTRKRRWRPVFDRAGLPEVPGDGAERRTGWRSRGPAAGDAGPDGAGSSLRRGHDADDGRPAAVAARHDPRRARHGMDTTGSSPMACPCPRDAAPTASPGRASRIPITGSIQPGKSPGCCWRKCCRSTTRRCSQLSERWNWASTARSADAARLVGYKSATLHLVVRCRFKATYCHCRRRSAGCWSLES